MKETVIVSAARTPIGKYGGVLKNLKAVELGGIMIKEVVDRANIDGDDIDLVIMGHVLQAGSGQIPSRQATIGAGLPFNVTSETINKVCASSMRSITLGDQIIRSGDADVIVAGGMESMSNAPFASFDLRWGNKMFDTSMVDIMVKDGLWCPYYDRHMAVHGGICAKEFGVTREEQDQWALRSQLLAKEAMESGKLDEEIIPITVKTKKGDVIVSTDESVRPNTTIEALRKLKPLFTDDNTVTAGNAPGTNDGASAMILMSKEKAEEMDKKILATIVGHAEFADEPSRIASVPGLAINKLLAKVNLTIDDIDLFEVNEAFAAVVLVSQKVTGWDPEKVNVNGGAIAYGHPLGASGARIVMTLIYEMRRRGAKYGIAAICSAAAQGDAVLVRCDY